MSEKPEQVLIEYWIAPACRIKKRGIEVAISQQHCDGRRKNRQCEQQHEGCHQNGPDEQRHLVERHARCAHVQDGGDEIDGPKDGRCSRQRSEEHTSELQSLMRTSYAAFCWKKNNYKSTTSQT